jgi:small conductance mechanosensitive channel
MPTIARLVTGGALMPDSKQIAEDLWTALTTYGLRAAGALLFLAVAWVGAGWVRRAMRQGLARTKFDLTLGKFLSNVVRWIILTLAVLACLGTFGIQTTGFAALIGAVGLAVGLGFQGTLGHLASGVLLLVFRPFKVGDVVNIAGSLGKVNEIDLFMTELDTPDGRRVIIPNSRIFGDVIENITHHPRRRADVNVGVAYDADLDQTRVVLEDAVRQVPGALADPPAEVLLQDLGSSSVNWVLRVWAPRDDFFKVRQAATRAAKVALDRAGITIPFPQMDVHLYKRD